MNNDKDFFRQALQRQNERAAGMKMPDDMEQRVMHRIRSKKANHRWLYPAIAAVAASILLLLVLRFSQEPVEEQSVVAETIEQNTPQPVPQPIIEVKTDEVLAEVPPAPQPAKKHKKAVRSQSSPIAEPVHLQEEPMLAAKTPLLELKPEEEDPAIPANKQALVDIYLSEEALQVSYKLQAQQETIRAYAASLSGEETRQPIIAF